MLNVPSFIVMTYNFTTSTTERSRHNNIESSSEGHFTVDEFYVLHYENKSKAVIATVKRKKCVNEEGTTSSLDNW